eukprot:TRINITY_DN1267_c0_g2_i1.p1 TRINITY_DN1267_c0_g2~~TRINITY_DN1267_c0_g2_i1.p1  ORF type:complete len:392 (+),score=161.74 TRINITY_DN1267_c0_g2_i1:168-1178(+)
MKEIEQLPQDEDDEPVDVEEQLKIADEEFNEGKELFLDGQYDDAADYFSSVLVIKGKHLGEDNITLADVYYYYGESLLMCYKNSESSLFGSSMSNALDKKEQAQEEEEADVEEFNDPNFDAKSEEVPDEGEDKQVENPNKHGDDETLEIAWNVLEIARNMYSRSSENEDKMKLSNVKLAQGSLLTEIDQLDNAKKEFQEAIAIRKSIYGDSRELAEVHYLYGVALSVDEKLLPEALENLNIAKDMLTKVMEGTEKEEEKSSLKEVIQELDSRINELNDIASEVNAPVEETLPEIASETKVMDITSNIRSNLGTKRKAEGDLAEESPLKKPKSTEEK